MEESSKLSPETQNGKFLKNSEDYLRKRFKNLTIIRPGGLFGEDRHPVFWLQGRSGLTTGDELLHLVHRDDVIESIKKIIEIQLWGEEFNLVNDLRVRKEDYYTEKAKSFGMPIPQYSSTHIENPTNISNAKSKKYLSVTYKN